MSFLSMTITTVELASYFTKIACFYRRTARLYRLYLEE